MSSSNLIQSRLPCPNCTSSDGYHVYDDGHGYCFSCKYHSSSKGSGDDETFTNSNSYTYEYLPWRGILKETFTFYGCKTKIDAAGKPVSIGFRYPNGSYKVRLIDRKEFFWHKSEPMIGDNEGQPTKPGLFGRDKFAAGSHKYVIITEGETDALSLYQALRTPVVSVQSASSAVANCIDDRSWLNSFERVYLAFDDDTAGRAACTAVARLFEYNKVFVVRFTPRKDANEWLQVHDGVDQLKNIFANSKKYLPETILSTKAEFAALLQEKVKWGVAYPFPKLTEMTYGLRRGESVLITAMEGVGKTELCHAIEYRLLCDTTDNIAGIFLEEPPRRHLEALASTHLKTPVHVPDTTVTQDQVIDAIGAVVKEDDRLHVYTRFGGDDPEVFLDTIRFLVVARNCHWVIVDHITMACSGRNEADERQKLDWFATQIEMMVQELNFGLIIVSHVNDLGQTRGSRYVAKLAHIRIDATRNILAESAVERHTVNLVVAKNRPYWKTGHAGSYYFDPLTYSYTEVANDNSQLEALATRAA